MVDSSIYWGRDDHVRYADTADKPGRLQAIIEHAHRALDWQLGGDEERALIVTDTEVSPILYHVVAGVLRIHGVEPTISVQARLDSPNAEPTEEIVGAIQETDFLINMMTYTIGHSAAVAEHVKSDPDTGYLLLADPTEDMFIRGILADDPEEVDRAAKLVGDALREGEWVEVTSAGGTDVEMSLAGRDPLVPTYPAAEPHLCPVEETVNGSIVHDSFMMGVGLLEEPIVWEVEDGRIQAIEGGREARALQQYIDEYGDDNAYWIGEFAIGVNPKARPTGNYVEHKNVRGSCHFALGTGIDMGGNYRSSIHLDGVQLTPTITVDGETIVDEGRLTIAE